MSKRSEFIAVLVGDPKVGKSYLTKTSESGIYPSSDYFKTACNYCHTPEVQMDSNTPNILIIKTAGNSDYDRLRPLSYKNADIFLLCFSVDSQASLDNITAKWLPEIKTHRPDLPYMIVALKKDLRTDNDDSDIITYENGKEIANRIGANGYYECSSLETDGTKPNQLWKEVSIIVSKKQSSSQTQSCCIIL